MGLSLRTYGNGQRTIRKKSKMADLINFVSKRVIDAKKEEKRKAREQILKKASVIAPL